MATFAPGKASSSGSASDEADSGDTVGQAHAAAAADPEIREQVRQRFMELIELSERRSGAPRELVLRHVARSMFGNVALALDLPPEYHPIG